MTYQQKKKCWSCERLLGHPHFEGCKRKHPEIEHDRVRLVDVISTKES